MRKILVISLVLSSLAFGQNDGLVKTYYPNGAIETEGNYTKGVRDGLWTFWYEGEVFEDFGEDGTPNTQDEGENNGVWDSRKGIVNSCLSRHNTSDFLRMIKFCLNADNVAKGQKKGEVWQLIANIIIDLASPNLEA